MKKNTKWEQDPNWNYIFDGKFYTKEDVVWKGASETPKDYNDNKNSDWDEAIKNLKTKTNRFTCIFEPTNWENNYVLEKIYKNIHPENASKTYYCNGDLRLKLNHKKVYNKYDFKINVFSFPWIPMQSWLWRDKKYTEKSGIEGCYGDTYYKHANMDYEKIYKIICPVNHLKINRIMTLDRLSNHNDFVYSLKNTDNINFDGTFDDEDFWSFFENGFNATKKKWEWSDDGNSIKVENTQIPVDKNIKFLINDFDVSVQKSFTDILRVPEKWTDDLNKNDYHNFFPTLEWLQSHVELIHETYCVNSGNFSEKTAKAIGQGKPFIVIGCQDWYKYFTSFGFVLYDELFDYSFDSIPSFKDRWERIMTQCEKILSMSHEELGYIIKKIQPKIMHNKEIMKNIGRSYMNRIVDAWLLANRILSLSFGFAHEHKEMAIHNNFNFDANDKRFNEEKYVLYGGTVIDDL